MVEEILVAAYQSIAVENVENRLQTPSIPVVGHSTPVIALPSQVPKGIKLHILQDPNNFLQLTESNSM